MAPAGSSSVALESYDAVFATGMINYVEYQMSRSLIETLRPSGETAP